MNNNIYLGIDIGGSAIKFGWGNCQQGLLCSNRTELKKNSLEYLKQSLDDIMCSIDKSIGLVNISAIGIGTPGTINTTTKKIVGVNPNLPEWTNLDIRTLFPQNIRDKICVDNDANLMALAEAQLLTDKHCVIGITIGSGIGCGIIIDGQIFHGAHGYAGELGHTTVKINGGLCKCGKRGCLEAYSSVSGLVTMANTINPSLFLADMHDIIEFTKISRKMKGCFNQSIKYLAVASANLAIALDADAVIFGGGVIELNEYPFLRLKEILLDLLSEPNKSQIKIEKAQYENRAGIMGAIIMAAKQRYHKSSE